jgi:diguanylate cyclase (GGDEF)-like protein
MWRDRLRPGDSLARYGGEEFVLLIRNCTLKDGIQTVERIRTSTSAACTCSAGVAEWSAGVDTSSLMNTADSALYEAKRAGRDRIWPAQVNETGSVARQPPPVLEPAFEQQSLPLVVGL